MTFFNRFPVRLETPTLCNSSEKMAVSFTIISDVAVTACVSINKKGADLFIKGILKTEKTLVDAISRSD